MNLLHAIILGIVEGLSEFLPISSTGHLILAAKLLGISSTEFVKTFEIFIQSGAILAVLTIYGRDLMKKNELSKKALVGFCPQVLFPVGIYMLIKHVFFSPNKEKVKRAKEFMLISFIPSTAIIGLALYKFIKTYLLGNTTVTLWSLFLGGIALILIELYFRRSNIQDRKTDISSLSYKNAALIGVVQSISVIPGVSRSAASIIGGMMFGLNRKTAVEFSFLLAIPTLIAATSLDLIKTNFNFNTNEWSLLTVGFLASFAVALLSIKWFISYVQKYSFIPFGVYRIIIAIFLAGLFFFH